MKVISGTLKGHNLLGYNVIGTRPTMGRIKESLFAMISSSLKDSICLDLFAGSGNLGIEALSNGAKYCYFVDNSPQAIKVIKTNISLLELKKLSSVMLIDWEKALKIFASQNIQFNIIFIDPPYSYDIYEDILKKIVNFHLLKDNGIVILEHSNLSLAKEYFHLILYKERKYHNKTISLYKNKI